MISVIVPLRVTDRPQSIHGRLLRLLRTLPDVFEVVVVDDTASGALRCRTVEIVARFSNARHLHHAASMDEVFSIGRLRDLGAAAAMHDLVLFHDIDFFAPPEIYRRLLSQWDGRVAFPATFACVPVAFLTRAGTALLRRPSAPVWPALAGASSRLVGLVDRVVLASSAIIVGRQALFEIGGHDPAFAGHGAEDFDLMHRLSERYPTGPRPVDYHRDFGSRRPERGFRGYFGRYGAPLLQARILLAHAWHPRRRDDPRYYAARKANFALLQERMGQTTP